jgi:hypothetical protein
MGSIIMRSALIAWGRTPPPELHSIVDNGRERRVVTWSDVMNARREQQRRRLDQIRQVEEWRPYRLSVSYFGCGLMGGWNAFIEGIHGRNEYGTWIDRDRRWLIPKLLTAFPLVLPLGSESEQWRHWEVAFASQYKRRMQHGEPVGVVPVWWNQRDSPRSGRERCEAHG